MNDLEPFSLKGASRCTTRGLNYSKRVLRPRHAKADPAIQEAFPQATVELWASDQHRVGLKPILRRVWVRKGSRPRVTVQHR